MMTQQNSPRIILLTTARTYRGRAFLQAAQKLNVDIIQVVNMAPELAAHWNIEYGIDFSDPERATRAIAELAIKTGANAIRAVDDSGTLIAAKASARLNLPHNSPLAAEAARNKHLMRSLFAKAGVPCPVFEQFTTDIAPETVAARVDYSCVVKPVSLSGSRGVMRANDPNELVNAIRRLTCILDGDQMQTTHPYLVEGFIPGFEVALEGMLDNGQLTILALFDKPDPLDGPFFEETIYVTPSRLPKETQQAIANCVTRSAHALGLREGPIHAELRINEIGPWILEIAGRSIGGLCSQTLRFNNDRSLEELILRQACGLEDKIPEREQQASGVMMIPIPEAGVLKGVHGMERARKTRLIEDIQITAKINYTLIPLPEGDSYLGFIFARGETPDEVERALRMAHNQLAFQIVPELNLALA